MTIKPALFSARMEQAVLENRKTVTRRAIKWSILKVYKMACCYGKWDESYWSAIPPELIEWYAKNIAKPPYKTGDILYVPEAWKGLCSWVKGVASPRYGYAVKFKDGEETEFYFDNAERAKKWRKYLEKPKEHWQSPYFMPREAARIFLRVKDVRVERLQSSFTEPICPIFELQSEGIDIGDTCLECIESYGEPCCVDTVDEDGTGISECGILDEVRDDFSRLWDSTIKPSEIGLYGWSADPWVWSVRFERVSKEEALGS